LTYVPGTTYNKEIDIAKAADAASKADAVVICLGEWAYAETPGNIADLTLPDAQLDLARKIMERKNPSSWCSPRGARASSAALRMLRRPS